MRIVSHYSHLGGAEYMIVRHEQLWDEIHTVIAGVDAETCRTEEGMFAPPGLNMAFKVGFQERQWTERRRKSWVTADEDLLRRIRVLPEEEQKQAIEQAGHEPIASCLQTNFVKDRVAVEVQFGRHEFVAHDLFVKHLSFYVANAIDVGIEVLPMKSMEEEMQSGVPYYERELLNAVHRGRGDPRVPLVLMGVAP